MVAMFVVFVVAEGEKPSLEVFAQRNHAALYAKMKVAGASDTADIYEIDDVTDSSDAKAALEMGNGRFVESRGQPANRARVLECPPPFFKPHQSARRP
jgi:hypothetical protein